MSTIRQFFVSSVVDVVVLDLISVNKFLFAEIDSDKGPNAAYQTKM